MKKKQKKENSCIPIASRSCPRPNGKNNSVVNKKPSCEMRNKVRKPPEKSVNYGFKFDEKLQDFFFTFSDAVIVNFQVHFHVCSLIQTK